MYLNKINLDIYKETHIYFKFFVLSFILLLFIRFNQFFFYSKQNFQNKHTSLKLNLRLKTLNPTLTEILKKTVTPYSNNSTLTILHKLKPKL